MPQIPIVRKTKSLSHETGLVNMNQIIINRDLYQKYARIFSNFSLAKIDDIFKWVFLLGK